MGNIDVQCNINVHKCVTCNGQPSEIVMALAHLSTVIVGNVSSIVIKTKIESMQINTSMRWGQVQGLWHPETCHMHYIHMSYFKFIVIIYCFNPRPVGVGLVTHPVGGGPFWPPPEISRTTPRSDKRKTALDSPRRELPVACMFFENRGHGSGQTEVKGQI